MASVCPSVRCAALPLAQPCVLQVAWRLIYVAGIAGIRGNLVFALSEALLVCRHGERLT